jgi:ribosomal protein S18 acetylase RimI-like enzyme
MEIKYILENKEKYMDLLLLADESENMINKYLNDGELFALYDDNLKTVCVVKKINEKIYEIKNIATYEKYQKNGYGTMMLKYVIENYKNKCEKLLIGTGDNERILSFYKKLGFINSHVIKDFFIKNYDHKMFEDGKQLKDMVYLKIDFKCIGNKK